MTEDIADQIYNLQIKAYQLPIGETRLRLYEEALRIAEQSRDLDLIFPARIHMAYAAGAAGYEEKTMAALAWCLATFEDNEERFLEYEKTLLLLFQTFLSNISQYPNITRDKFEQLAGQLESLICRFGYSLRSVYLVRLWFAITIGDRLMAIESHAKYVSYPRDNLGRSVVSEDASEANLEFWYLSFLGETEKAIELASRIIAEKVSSNCVPHDTYNCVLRLLALLQRYEEADDYQKRGYRLIRNIRGFLELIGHQIAYLLHRGRTAAAIRMFERHLLWGLETFDLAARYRFYTAAKHLFTSLSQTKSTCKLSLPSSFPLYKESSEYNISQLIDWFDKETSSLATAFDQRNGNDFFSVVIPKQLKY
ncbi:hypothetical protein [Blastopirellula marina]|uniref:Uncharacterized protein n=1 Tax=Blastopirellula marina DSM 3645 TaxID=314230 RepID=A4A1B9_9BACT|nr:hypothetical protein [Blastopirellula marina]EAQ77471.1 hypothetical protein DSM3645_20152 [Blastopirellula marina DSM 3645]